MAKASIMVHVYEMCWESYGVFSGKTPSAGLLPFTSTVCWWWSKLFMKKGKVKSVKHLGIQQCNVSWEVLWSGVFFFLFGAARTFEWAKTWACARRLGDTIARQGDVKAAVLKWDLFESASSSVWASLNQTFFLPLPTQQQQSLGVQGWLTRWLTKQRTNCLIRTCRRSGRHPLWSAR